MPRTARIPSKTGWAHVVSRGINQENLFYDDEDFNCFMSIARKDFEDFSIDYADICQMSNHVHMLLHEENGTFGPVMHHIETAYARYYNNKYERVGHVFQDRYKCVPIESERAFLSVARYIYQNPSNAHICAAREYQHTFIKSGYFIPEHFKDTEEMLSWFSLKNHDGCMEYDRPSKYEDQDILEIIADLTGSDNPQILLNVEASVRNYVLKELKDLGISARRISRITGLNRNIVQRAK